MSSITEPDRGDPLDREKTTTGSASVGSDLASPPYTLVSHEHSGEKPSPKSTPKQGSDEDVRGSGMSLRAAGDGTQPDVQDTFGSTSTAYDHIEATAGFKRRAPSFFETAIGGIIVVTLVATTVGRSREDISQSTYNSVMLGVMPAFAVWVRQCAKKGYISWPFERGRKVDLLSASATSQARADEGGSHPEQESSQVMHYPNDRNDSHGSDDS